MPATTQGCQPQRSILKVTKCISNLNKFYKYLKNLQIFFLILPCALKSCSHYVQNYYNLKEIVPLEQVGEAGPLLEPNSRYATGW